LKNTGEIFEDELQRQKDWNVINRNLGNMQHRPKAGIMKPADWRICVLERTRSL